MRITPLLVAAVSLAACAKPEAAKTDSAAPTAASPAAPAALTAADVAGTVNGKIMPQNADSVIFTFVCVTPATGNVSRCTNSMTPNDTTSYTYALSGADSVTWTSDAYTPPTPPKSPKVIDHVVGRMSRGKWTGTVTTVLASKPDSVVSRARWEATKTQ